MQQDTAIIRELAREYMSFAHNDSIKEKLSLHKKVNDLKMERPVVLIDEVPWHEMNFDGSLTVKCQDEYLKQVEFHLRRIIFQQKHFPADTIIRPYIAVEKIINTTGIGIHVEEDILQADKSNTIISHEYDSSDLRVYTKNVSTLFES